jgi:myo-inositol-1(or 4)-monophosphatase
MLEGLIEIAHEAGEIVLAGYEQRLPGMDKGEFDVVTEADHASGEWISKRLREAYPGIGIVSEEAEAEGCLERYWLVDPLDGTKNFSHGHPFFCVTMALVEAGRPVLGVTYDPVRRETFAAERGQGATRNGEPMRVSEVGTLKKAMLTSGFPSSRRHQDLDTKVFLEILMSSQALRRSGCSGLDLAYVACGRFDAVFDWGLSPWDVAAGLLLVEEAGGVCVNWQGEGYRLDEAGMLCGNAELVGLLREKLSGRQF